MRPSVAEALDTDLDAYLDRELFARPLDPTLELEPEAEPASVPASVPGKASAPATKVMRLAAEEQAWLRARPLAPAPEPEAARPVPEPLPAVPMSGPVDQPWSAPPTPPLAAAPSPLPGLRPWGQPPVAPRRSVWLIAGALLGVALVGALMTGVLWLERLGSSSAARPARVSVPGVLIVEVADAPARKSVVPPPVGAQAPRAGEVAPPQGIPAGPDVKTPPLPHPGAVTPDEEPSSRVWTEHRTLVLEAPTALEPEAQGGRPGRAGREAMPVSALGARGHLRPVPSTEEAAPLTGRYEDYDAEYARQMGFTETKPKAEEPRPPPGAPRSVWVPPAPGEALPERLSVQDIQRVVGGHATDVRLCIQQYRASPEALPHGRLMARWNVRADGTTAGVSVETAEFQDTELARCLEGLIGAWMFPRHRVEQREPIRFPFTF
ncbi:AgmX/PglI C-terminal domain-containing protein [Myxococcaceae bacterium GXIMD 01537]